VFVSSISSGGLNRAHATWLEHALIQRAIKADRSHLENGTEPQAPQLSEAEKADTQAFLREMLQILPLVGLNAFEIPKAVAAPMAKSFDVAVSKAATDGKALADDIDTIVYQPQKDGFERVFIGENAGMPSAFREACCRKSNTCRLSKSASFSDHSCRARCQNRAVRDGGKYKLIFSEPAKKIGPFLLPMLRRA